MQLELTCMLSAASRSNAGKSRGDLTVDLGADLGFSQLGLQLLSKAWKMDKSLSKRLSPGRSNKEVTQASMEDSASHFNALGLGGGRERSASSYTTREPSKRSMIEASACLMFRADGSL